MAYLAAHQLTTVTLEGVVDHLGYLTDVAERQGKADGFS